MAVMNLNVNFRMLLFMMVVLAFFNRHVDGFYGCVRSWNLYQGHPTINNIYKIVVEPDQVYSLKSPGLYKLSYPRLSLFTWDLHTSNESAMTMLMYLLHMRTDGYCDVLRLETFDQHMDINELFTTPGLNPTQGNYNGTYSTTPNYGTVSNYHYTVNNEIHKVSYWSGNMQYAYDYITHKQRFLEVEFVKSHYAILQFNTDYHTNSWSDHGFVIRVMPLLHAKTRIEQDEWSNQTFPADSTVQQLALHPGPLHEDFGVASLTIFAEHSGRVLVNIIFMNINNKADCSNTFIEIVDGANDEDLLLKSCRNMTISSPLQAVSVSNSLVVRYKCNTIQIYNLREKQYETSPCAVLNYQVYELASLNDRSIDTAWFLEITGADFGKPYEFAGNYLRLSLALNLDIQIVLQSEKYEVEEDIVKIEISAASGVYRELSISHRLQGEHWVRTFQHIEIAPNEFDIQNAWIAVENNEVSAGLGHELRKDVQIIHPIKGSLQFKYFQVNGDSRRPVKVFSDCDQTFGNRLTPLPVAKEPKVIYHSVSMGSTYMRNWMIRKEHPHQILQFKISSHLLSSPDCEWEGVTIYRGTCLSWRKKVGDFCGKVEEIFSETTHLETVIQFHTKADISVDREFNAGSHSRHFEIEYKVLHPDEQEDKKDFNTGLFIAIAITVIIIAVVVAIICYVRFSKKKRPRQVTAQSAVQDAQVHQNPQFQSQPNTMQPIQLKINIDNTGQIAAMPNMLYHKGEVQTSVSYTGIPPPALYDPSSLYQGPSHPVGPALPKEMG